MPTHGYTPNTWKLWCGTPPASTPSARNWNLLPTCCRNRSAIESPSFPIENPVEQFVADPVGLHHPLVQRVPMSQPAEISSRYGHAPENACDLPDQPLVDHAGLGVLAEAESGPQ